MSDDVLKPTQPGERLFHVDVLRGVAIFGILVVNMMFFVWPFYHILIDVQPWSGIANDIAQGFIWFFAETNFITMFSLLFGFGFYMLFQRASARQQNVRPLFVRRMFVLLGFGLVHTFFFWVHDVLVYFALVGFLLLLFRNKEPRSLTKWAVAAILIPMMFVLIAGGLGSLAAATPEGAAEMEAALSEQREMFAGMYEQALTTYGSGTFIEVTIQRSIDFVMEFIGSFLTSQLFLILAMFLTGLNLGKRGMFADPETHIEGWNRLLKWGLIVGLPTSAVYTVTGFFMEPMGVGAATTLHGASALVAGPALCLAYVSMIVKACRSERVRRVLSPVAAVGRNALSNYLFQSVICTTLFFGYGFGLYAGFGPAIGLLVTVAIYAVQLAISSWYVDRFRYGPAELLWRKLTYKAV